MKIALINQPTGNRGDEAAHKAFVRSLAKELPEVQIDIIFINHKQDRIDSFNVKLPTVRYINLKSLIPLWRLLPFCYCTHTIFLTYLHPVLWKFRKLLNKYDKVICAPGGMCMGGFKLWSHIYTLEIAKRLHKPIYYWGRSIGPFLEEDYSSRIFKHNSINLLNYFAYISLRDSISVQYAKDLGINVEEVVDSALLECPNTLVPENILQRIGNDYVVFVPNELTWHPRYTNISQQIIDDFFLSIISLFKEMWPKRTIVMLPQTYQSKIDDYSYFKRIATKSNNKNIVVIDERQNSDIQQKIISGSQLVIGARYHSIIFAINNQVPFISLSYEHKMKGFLEKLGMTEYMVEIQDIFDDDNSDLLKVALNKIHQLLSLNHSYSNQEAKHIVNDGFNHLVKLLKS